MRPSSATCTGMDLLGALRLCANIAGQFAIEAALTADDSSALCARRTPVNDTRKALVESCAASEHLANWCTPAGALYGFPAVVGAAG